MNATIRRRWLTLGMALLAVPVLASSCFPLKTVRVKTPVDGALIDDSSFTGTVLLGRNFDELSGVVRLNGVDLIAELALTPPFLGEGGVVTVGGDTVTISNFDYELLPAPAPYRIAFEVSGLSVGTHTLEGEGQETAGPLVTVSNDFDVVVPFTIEHDVVASAGLPDGEQDAGSEGFLVNATLGDPIAGPPVPMSGGGELREGFVPVAEARIAGAP